MAANSTVLREYLVALGFKVDEANGRKFDKGLDRWDKKAADLAKGLVGVGIAAQAMVAKFAWSMEKLYYASRRTDSAVGSIQALEYGASKVGVSGERMRGALESMARNLRANPGLTGLLNSLGVKVEGRDKSDVLTDLVGQLKKMPFYVAEQYANLFGIDPDTLFMLQDGLDLMKKAQAERKAMAADMGVDAQAAAEASKEYANAWREIAERAGLFRDTLAIELLPLMRELAAVTNQVLIDWVKIVKMPKGEVETKLMEGLGLTAPGDRQSGVVLSKESQDRLGVPIEDRDPNEGGRHHKRLVDRWIDRFRKWGGAKEMQTPLADQASVDAAQDDSAFKRGGTGGATNQQTSGNAGAAALFARLEKQYALTPGTLDRIWKAESGRGENLTGPMTRYGQAKGHFQFLDSTGAEMGLDADGGRGDRDDLEKSAKAAAAYYSRLKTKYDGDDRKAAAAYNWGQGNLDRYGLGAAPRETRDYMDKVAPVTINQENNVTVNAANNPQAVAAATRQEMDASNADVIRNQRIKVH